LILCLWIKQNIPQVSDSCTGIGHITHSVSILLAQSGDEKCTCITHHKFYYVHLFHPCCRPGSECKHWEVIIKLGRLLDEDVIIGEALAYELSQLEMNQLTRFERLSELTDIEECIPNIQKASSGDHQWPYRWYLSNLAQGVRFERLGELTDLEQAVSNLHRAVQLID
jgi:hypothetical protein